MEFIFSEDPFFFLAYPISSYETVRDLICHNKDENFPVLVSNIHNVIVQNAHLEFPHDLGSVQFNLKHVILVYHHVIANICLGVDNI